MTFIRDYAVSIILVSVLALLFESIAPLGKDKKYLGIAIGLLMMLVILNPLTKLPHYAETFALPRLRIDDSALQIQDASPLVARQFERKLALTICEDVHQTYGQTVSVRVYCDVNDTGQINAVTSLHLTPFSKDIAAYIAQKYGFSEDIILP